MPGLARHSLPLVDALKSIAPSLLLVVPDDGLGCGIGVALARSLDVVVATTGAEGLSRLIQSPSDFAAVDLSLRDMDGSVLLRAIRARAPDCVAVAIASDLIALRTPLAARIHGVLEKPLTVSRLLRALHAPAGATGRRFAEARPVSGAVDRAVAYASRHYATPLDVDSIAAAAGVSPSTLAHRFPAELGMTISHFVTQLRVEIAKRWLVGSGQKLETLAQMTGFFDAAHLSRAFHRIVGMSPGRYRHLASRLQRIVLQG